MSLNKNCDLMDVEEDAPIRLMTSINQQTVQTMLITPDNAEDHLLSTLINRRRSCIPWKAMWETLPTYITGFFDFSAAQKCSHKKAIQNNMTCRGYNPHHNLERQCNVHFEWI